MSTILFDQCSYYPLSLAQVEPEKKTADWKRLDITIQDLRSTAVVVVKFWNNNTTVARNTEVGQHINIRNVITTKYKDWLSLRATDETTIDVSNFQYT